MNFTRFPKPIQNLLWASDLHLDETSSSAKRRFIDEIAQDGHDAVLVTGDIANSKQLVEELELLAEALCPRPLIVTLGNHDHFNSTLAAVDDAMKSLCRRIPNLVHLDHAGIVELTPNTCLIGNMGWYDGRAGAGAGTKIYDRGRHAIGDFDGMSRRDYFAKLGELGKWSANHVRQRLPLALSNYQRVLIGTHVPPFWNGILYSGAGCSWEHQPYYANVAAGKAVRSIFRGFARRQTGTRRQLDILAGHAHSRASKSIMRNLTQHIAEARRGVPAVERLLKIA